MLCLTILFGLITATLFIIWIYKGWQGLGTLTITACICFALTSIQYMRATIAEQEMLAKQELEAEHQMFKDAGCKIDSFQTTRYGYRTIWLCNDGKHIGRVE